MLKKIIKKILPTIVFITILVLIYGVGLRAAIRSQRVTRFVNRTFQFLIERVER